MSASQPAAPDALRHEAVLNGPPPAGRHLLGIAGMDAGSITGWLDSAEQFAKRLESGSPVPRTLEGKIAITLFFENSTRTRTSFEMAASRLGAATINFETGTSSLAKGETFMDTVQTIAAMGPDALIVRHSEYGAPHFIAARLGARCPVIKAGDSWHEHPTQALLDALTIRRQFGYFEGLRIAIVGDIAHSRVAASNMILLTAMGASVAIVAPPELMPDRLPAEGIDRFDNLKDGLEGADLVMTIRPQKERMSSVLIDDAAYFSGYGLTYDSLAFAKPGALVLDPGPFLREVQIASDLADDPKRFLYLKQVANGVALRMAVLNRLMGGEDAA